MSALVDQTDDSELLPPKADDVVALMQRYVLLMGAPRRACISGWPF